jgi:diguanylate cyclase (GGDEF)-like protein
VRFVRLEGIIRRNAGRTRGFLAAATGFCLLLHAPWSLSGQLDAAALLSRADHLRSSNYTAFCRILQTLQSHSTELSDPQREYLQYLQGWKEGYDGNNSAAIAQLESIYDHGRDMTLRFRSAITAVDLLSLTGQYVRAFSLLNESSALLPRVSGMARQQGLLDGASLYNDVGQYRFSLRDAQLLIKENWDGLGRCKGEEERMRALYESGAVRSIIPELSRAIDGCDRVGEPNYANTMRLLAARADIHAGRFAQATDRLSRHLDEVRNSGNPRLAADYDSLLAAAYEGAGSLDRARMLALSSVAAAQKVRFLKPQIEAYRVLYELERSRGNYAAALSFYQHYSDAQMSSLKEKAAIQLAFEQVMHDNIAKQLEIEALGRKNRVLELEHRLAAKQMEATRLYGVILTLVLGFIGLWALLTKRSQLHFKTLSRLDGLTGICNRLHFIERAEAALAYARKSGQEVSLVLFDLDYFKSINDRFGHATGDFVLQRAAALCKEYLRRSDIFGRFGGEEFSVLLPACRLEEARNQAEQLRLTIKGIAAEHRGAPVTASASFGISSSAASGYDLARLLAHADAALYRAKRAGRDCVMAYDVAESGEVKAIALAPPQA